MRKQRRVALTDPHDTPLANQEQGAYSSQIAGQRGREDGDVIVRVVAFIMHVHAFGNGASEGVLNGGWRWRMTVPLSAEQFPNSSQDIVERDQYE